MATQTYQSIVVTGVLDSDDAEIAKAHESACFMFEEGLVSDLTADGHNFISSFCIFPNGSGNQREPQTWHRKSIDKFCEWLATTHLEFVAVKWDDSSSPTITHSHDMPQTESNFKLVLASNTHYSEEQLKLLKPFLNRPVSLKDLISLPVVVALVPAECTSTVVAIDHPHGW